MRPLHLLAIVFLIIGAAKMLDWADDWQLYNSTGPRTLAADTSDTSGAEDSRRVSVKAPHVEATPRVEYLMKSGKVEPTHQYVLAPGQSDARVWQAAILVSCLATRDCK